MTDLDIVEIVIYMIISDNLLGCQDQSLLELEDLIAHDMFALLEAIQLSLKSRNPMPAQNSLHCTAQFIFMATHVTGNAFKANGNDSIQIGIRYHKSDTALTVTRQIILACLISKVIVLESGKCVFS